MCSTDVKAGESLGPKSKGTASGDSVDAIAVA